MIGLVVSFGSEDKGGCQQSQNPVMECLLIWLTWCQSLIGVSLIRRLNLSLVLTEHLLII